MVPSSTIEIVVIGLILLAGGYGCYKVATFITDTVSGITDTASSILNPFKKITDLPLSLFGYNHKTKVPRPQIDALKQDTLALERTLKSKGYDIKIAVNHPLDVGIYQRSAHLGPSFISTYHV